MTSFKLALVGCLALSASVAPAQSTRSPSAANRRMPTIDDLLGMGLVSTPAISPDGEWVAWVVTRADRARNVNNSTIWLAPSAGGTPVQLTRGPRADRAPQWSPDSKWIAFLSDRVERDRAQVYGIAPSGGEAWRITDSAVAVTSFRLSPNGRDIAYLAATKASRADEALEVERGRPTVRDSAYASDWSHAWVASLADGRAGAARRSSPDLLDVTSIEWAPDSKRLAWSAKPSPVLRYNDLSAVYVQDSVGAAPRRISDMPGAESVEAWTEELGVVVSSSAHDIGTFNSRLFAVPPSGGAPVSITDALDEDAHFVAATSSAIYVEAPIHAQRGLFRIALAGPPGAVRGGTPVRVGDSTRFVSAFSLSRRGDVAAFIGESSQSAPDVYAVRLATSPTTLASAPRRLSDVNPQSANLAFGEQRVVQWKSAADGESIEGILTLPTSYRPGVRVPLLLVIHGGPTGVSSDRFPSLRGAYPIAVFNALGYAVLQPNYRGSTGYGERFRGLNRGHISGEDWIDVNSGVDHLIAAGIADSTALGIMGWSFGGHHTYWGITHTHRFKAASAGAGATDLISMYSETDLPDFYRTYLGPRPWEDFKLYEARSAYRFVADVTTPLLIQVGEADRRVPAEQSIQFYEAMKGIGRTPVQLVLYPGQPHGISDPRLSRDLMQRNVGWFTRWIPTMRSAPASSTTP
jgi:dipeptidyl aminopeptidase/acylaminoacyl peptidase